MRKKLLLTTYMFIVCIAATGTAKAQTIISFDPTPYTVEELGITFKVNVTIANSPDIVQWMVRVSWDPSVLECVMVEEGPWLSQDGAITTVFLAKPINNTIGEIPEMTCITWDEVSTSGSGTIAIITFNGTAVGQTDLVIYESALLDEVATNQTHATSPGNVTVIPEFPASIILPLFLIITTAIAILAKAAWPRRRRGYINAP